MDIVFINTQCFSDTMYRHVLYYHNFVLPYCPLLAASTYECPQMEFYFFGNYIINTYIYLQLHHSML